MPHSSSRWTMVELVDPLEVFSLLHYAHYWRHLFLQTHQSQSAYSNSLQILAFAHCCIRYCLLQEELVSSIISNEGLCIISSYLPIIYSRFFSHKLIDTRTALTEQINLRNHIFVAKKNLTPCNMYGDNVLFNTNKLWELAIPFIDLPSSLP